MNYEEAYKESIKRTREFVKRGSLTIDFAKAIFDDFEMDEDEVIRKKIIKLVEEHSVNHERCIMTDWLYKQIPPKWLYRLEYKDGTCGLWYNGEGKWCFEQGIGSVEGCKTKDLPMDHDERYKQDGRDWFSSCSRKEDLMHWYSLEDAEELIKKGFVFTRYLATEYHEYENETVFIKESSLVREEIDIFELFGKTKPMFKEGDWIVNNKMGTIHQIKNTVLNLTTSEYGYDLTDGGYVSMVSVNEYRLWTIQDAKPGDIIVEGSRYITIYQSPTPNSETTFRSFCFVDLDSDVFVDEVGSHNIRGSYPAAKEQRDILFQKIKEAGYEWDAENLELRKVEAEKKPTGWNEKDERNLKFVISKLGIDKDLYADIYSWLGHIRERVYQVRWDEEDEYMLRKIIISIEDLRYKNPDKEQYYSEMSNWLMFIKDQIASHSEHKRKPKQEQLE